MYWHECIGGIVIDTVIAIFIIYTILNVIYCLILTSNFSVNYVHIFLKIVLGKNAIDLENNFFFVIRNEMF